MNYHQVRDVLKTIRLFHNQLARACERLGDQTDDERLELLMTIVAQYEQRFSAVLNRYEADVAEGVLNTWLQYAPTEEIQDALQTAELADANSVAEIAQMVWEFEEALVNLYRQLAESTAVPRVQELFSSLLEQELNKTGKYAWSLEEFQATESRCAERDRFQIASSTVVTVARNQVPHNIGVQRLSRSAYFFLLFGTGIVGPGIFVRIDVHFLLFDPDCSLFRPDARAAYFGPDLCQFCAEEQDHR